MRRISISSFAVVTTILGIVAVTAFILIMGADVAPPHETETLEELMGLLSVHIIRLCPLVAFAMWLAYALPEVWGTPKAQALPAVDYSEYNRKEVIGWELADKKDLESLPPFELQAKLDSQNPHCSTIEELRTMLNDPILDPRSQHESVVAKRQEIEAEIVTYQAGFVDFRVGMLVPGQDEILQRIDRECAPAEEVGA